ncbi:MAG: ABC transporter ATP-binding protein, partial [Rubrivivax sp.]
MSAAPAGRPAPGALAAPVSAAPRTAPAPALLEIDGLQVGFQTEDGLLRAVDGVSLRIEAGQTLGVVGESGCG